MRNMKEYIVVKDNKLETLVQIHKDFIDEFHVDLDSQKYLDISENGIENEWNAIMKDCFKERDYTEDLWKLPQEIYFLKMELDQYDLVGADGEVRDRSFSDNAVKEKILEIIEELRELYNAY